MHLNEITPNKNLLKKFKSEIDFALDKYNKGIVIYRGSETYEDNIIRYIDPTLRPTDRKSANTFNYYTLWMSNNLDWSKYPKRNRSLICTTDLYTSQDYGEPTIVVPLMNCKIGVCPTSDLWQSFKLVPQIGSFIDDLSFWFDQKWPDEDNDDLTYQELLIKLKNFTPIDCTRDCRLKQLLDRFNNAEELMQAIFNPIENNFKLLSWKQFNIKGTRELWLSAHCLIINITTFEKLATEQKNASK